MNNAIQAANHLLQAKQTQQRIPLLPEPCRPTTIAAAYAVQDALVEQLLTTASGPQIGYKVGCTNKAAQEFLGLDGPFYGRMFAGSTYESGMQLSPSHFFMQVIEPEFGLELAADLPPIAGEYNQAMVAEAVGAVLPVIEIVDSVYLDWRSVGAAALIADNGCHGAWIKGQPLTDWHSLDLATHEMALLVNEQPNQIGCGSGVLGHPLNALVWLANALSERGLGLKAGDFISTGVCVDAVYDAQPGEAIRADFGLLGDVSVSFATD